MEVVPIRSRIIALLVAAVMVAGVGGYALYSLNSTPEDEAIRLVPQDAIAYAHAFLTPSVDQRKALRDLLERFEGAPEAGEVLNPLIDAIDLELSRFEMTYEEDVAPWLGNEIGMFASAVFPVPTAALLLEADDEDAALAFLDEIVRAEGMPLTEEQHEGIGYRAIDEGLAFGIVDGFAVIGTEPSLRASINATRGDSLADSDAYAELDEALTEDRIFSLFLDIGTAVGSSLALVLPSSLTSWLDGPISPMLIAGFVTDRSAVTELAQRDEAGTARNRLPAWSLPARSWLAVSVPALGDLARGAYAQFDLLAATDPAVRAQVAVFEATTGLDLEEDVLAWVGDAALFARGGGIDIDGGLAVSTGDQASSSRAVEALVRYAAAEGLDVRDGTVAGIPSHEIWVPAAPRPIVVVPTDPVVVAFGTEAAEDLLSNDDDLMGDSAFIEGGDLLGAGFEPFFFLRLDVIVDLIDMFAAGDPTYRADVRPVAKALTQVVAGSRLTGDVRIHRLVIGAE